MLDHTVQPHLYHVFFWGIKGPSDSLLGEISPMAPPTDGHELPRLACHKEADLCLGCVVSASQVDSSPRPLCSGLGSLHRAETHTRGQGLHCHTSAGLPAMQPLHSLKLAHPLRVSCPLHIPAHMSGQLSLNWLFKLKALQLSCFPPLCSHLRTPSMF